MLAVVALVAAAGAVVGLTSSDDGANDDEIAALEAELDDTEADSAERIADLETAVAGAESELDSLSSAFPVTSDDVLGADPVGTWAASATFVDCTGVEGGADQCRTLGDGVLEFEMTIGFSDGTFTVESDELTSATLTRDPAFSYLLEGAPAATLVPEFTCGTTTSAPQVAATFTNQSAVAGETGLLAFSLTGALVITVTPSIPDCETSVLNYSLVADPVG